MSFRYGESGGVPLVAPAYLLTVQVLRRKMCAPEVVTRSLVLPDTEQAPTLYQPGQFVTLAHGLEPSGGTCARTVQQPTIKRANP